MSDKKSRRENFERQDLDKPSRKGWGNRRRSAKKRMPDIKEFDIGETEFFDQFTPPDRPGANDQPD
jgi:hypothetical protein